MLNALYFSTYPSELLFQSKIYDFHVRFTSQVFDLIRKKTDEVEGMSKVYIPKALFLPHIY